MTSDERRVHSRLFGRSARALTDERGIAGVVAVLVMGVLLTLTMGLMLVAQTEPVIATNLLLGRQAQFLAESGVESAVWALNNPAHAAGIPTTAVGVAPSTPMPARYNSTLPHGATATFIDLGTGGYTVTVVPVAGSKQVTVTATGWNPAIANARAKSIVMVTLNSFAGRFNSLPGAVTANGQISFTGNALADGTADPPTSACGGSKYGTWSTGTASFAGSSGTLGNGPTPCSPGTCSSGSAQSQPAAGLKPFTLTASEIARLKALAQTSGTYVGPAGTLPSPVPAGLVFVDTTDGLPPNGPPATNMSSVTINSANVTGTGNWLIVMGALTIQGNVTYNGLIYAADTFTYRGTGSGGVTGAVISLHASNPDSNVGDVTDTGNSNVTFSCDAIQPPPALGGSYFAVPGTWQLLPG